jgi:hypothetical protein
MRCAKCGRRTCVTHRCEWHEGRTCEAYDADARASEEALLQALQAVVPCPMCCSWVEKNGGCDLMRCHCSYEFCWRCKAPYGGPDGIWEVGNKAHQPSCKFHM